MLPLFVPSSSCRKTIMWSMRWLTFVGRTAPCWPASCSGSYDTSEMKLPYWGRWMTEKLIWRVGLSLCIIQSSVFNRKQMSQLHRGWAASLRLVHHVLAIEQSFSFACAFYTVLLFKRWTIVHLNWAIKHRLANVQCVLRRALTIPLLVASTQWIYKLSHGESFPYEYLIVTWPAERLWSNNSMT